MTNDSCVGLKVIVPNLTFSVVYMPGIHLQKKVHRRRGAYFHYFSCHVEEFDCPTCGHKFETQGEVNIHYIENHVQQEDSDSECSESDSDDLTGFHSPAKSNWDSFNKERWVWEHEKDSMFINACNRGAVSRKHVRKLKYDGWKRYDDSRTQGKKTPSPPKKRKMNITNLTCTECHAGPFTDVSQMHNHYIDVHLQEQVHALESPKKHTSSRVCTSPPSTTDVEERKTSEASTSGDVVVISSDEESSSITPPPSVSSVDKISLGDICASSRCGAWTKGGQAAKYFWVSREENILSSVQTAKIVFDDDGKPKFGGIKVRQEEDYIDRCEVEYHTQGKVLVVIKKGDKLEDRAGEAQDVFKGMDGFEVFPKTSNQKCYAKFVNKGVFMSKREIKQELEMYDEDL
ncbi:uncharacterized protein [Ptychodera flava]|uniref:uncharacterized protein n=1 Tax=Ptychodera flava TaxID=63121 RepID=UPI003969E736